MNTTLDIRPANDRDLTDIGWLHSRHSFNFGHHHRPNNGGHGLLIVSNDDVVAPGGGFGTHPHRDMEIVTWVLEGALEHRDSQGNQGIIYPGLAQRMSAGTGITHSEMNASQDEPVRFIQMWVLPDTPGVTPGYQQLDVNEHLAPASLVPVASGQGHPNTIHLHQQGAVMWVGRLEAGDTVTLPDAPFVHAFVAIGAGQLDGSPLAKGDAARLSQAGPVAFTATTTTEIIVWETDTEVSR
jgi:redox-sensitive bicupin YhaK (pirin superfamily)